MTGPGKGNRRRRTVRSAIGSGRRQPLRLAMVNLPSSPARSLPVRPAPAAERTLPGIALVLATLFLFSCQDGISKLLAADYDPAQITFMRYLTMLALLAVPLLRAPGALRTRIPLLQIGRGVCLFASAILFIHALAYLPIAEATTIAFVSPLLVTALSIPLLGETVGIRRWSAVGIGFLGVLVVLRPGTGAFQPAALLPLASASAWAAALVLTRKMRGVDRALTTLVWSTLSGLLGAAVMLPFVWAPLTARSFALMAGQGILSLIGQMLLIVAYGWAPASVLAPFAYSQMLWATLIGYVVFAAVPARSTWLGAAIIVASGLYILHRERALATQRQRRAAPPA